MKEVIKNKKNIVPLICASLGLIAIIIGFVLLGHIASRSGSYPESVSFGGDYQTYIYKATRYAADNAADIVYSLNDISFVLSVGFGWAFILGGIMDICIFGSKISLPKRSVTPVEDSAPAVEDSAPAVEDSAPAVEDSAE